MRQETHALVYDAPGQVTLSRVELPEMAPGMVEVRTKYSGLSRGTERLVFNGAVPVSEHARMRAPFQVGDFPFPVRYGYAAVGEVVDGPEALLGHDVFCLYPHQTRFRVPESAVVPLPADLPAKRAVLAANMETALNAFWDANIAPGQRVLVVGAGLLGWLVTDLLSRRKDLDICLTDVRALSGIHLHDKLVRPIPPNEVAPEAFDVAFHTSASDAGLATALNALVFEGKVIELSWYGDRSVSVPLGGAFHANRLQIISSQVGHVAPRKRASTSYRDRMKRALELLVPDHLDQLITADAAFFDLATELPHLLGGDAPGIATRIVYPQ